VEEQRAGGRLEDDRQIQSGMVTGRGEKGMGARVQGAPGHGGGRSTEHVGQARWSVRAGVKVERTG
jgi:hypothetical protein